LGKSLAKTRLSFKGFSMTRKRTKLNFVTFGKEKEKKKKISQQVHIVATINISSHKYVHGKIASPHGGLNKTRK
jgi:uncharacterized protein YfbU (UPF0304 family)